MRTKTLIVFTLLALLVSACGGSGDEVADEPAAEEPAAEEPTGDEPVEKEAASEPDPEPDLEPEAEVDDDLEAAMGAAGTYTGTWTNTTFGSSGQATLTLTVTEDGGVTMEWDLGGGVFGAGDPDGESQAINIADLEAGAMITTDLFGDVLFSAADEFRTHTMDAKDVPAAGIQAFRAIATFGEDGTITGTYVVEWEDGGAPAEGIFELARG